MDPENDICANLPRTNIDQVLLKHWRRRAVALARVGKRLYAGAPLLLLLTVCGGPGKGQIPTAAAPVTVRDSQIPTASQEQLAKTMRVAEPSPIRARKFFPTFQQTNGDANRAGYIDETGRVVIDFRFYYAGEFSEQLAPVHIKREQGEGYIDQTGNVVIEPRFEVAHRFSEGLAAVRTKGLWGYIDQTGNEVIGPRFQFGGDFSEGLAPVRVLGRWGLSTKPAVENQSHFESATAFSEGIAGVVSNGSAGYIDKKGQWIIAPRFEKMSSLFEQQWLAGFTEGLAVFKRGGRYGFIDRKVSFGRVLPRRNWAIFQFLLTGRFSI